MYRGIVSDDGNYLMVKIRNPKESNILIADISKGIPKSNIKFKTLISGFLGEHSFIHNVGKNLYFKTNYKADRGRIVLVNIDKSEPNNWKTIVAEDINSVIDEVDCANNMLVI